MKKTAFCHYAVWSRRVNDVSEVLAAPSSWRKSPHDGFGLFAAQHGPDPRRLPYSC
jgi:hypothetical protein